MERQCEKVQKFYAHSIEGKPKSEWQGRAKNRLSAFSGQCSAKT